MCIVTKAIIDNSILIGLKRLLNVLSFPPLLLMQTKKIQVHFFALITSSLGKNVLQFFPTAGHSVIFLCI